MLNILFASGEKDVKKKFPRTDDEDKNEGRNRKEDWKRARQNKDAKKE